MMTKPFAVALLGLGALFAADRAAANDAVAAIGAGGIELLSTDEIAMMSEDLYISLEEIRVRYEFRNLTDRDVVTTVAFPLPVVDMWESFVMGGGGLVSETYDFVGFRLWIDGRSVVPELDVRARMEGRDVTAVLTGLGIPLSTHHPGFFDRWSGLSPKELELLEREGLADVYVHNSDPLWQVEAVYHWEQTFPAGRTVVVEHAYTPVTGGTFLIHHADWTEDFWFREEYCVDASTEAGIRRRLDQMRPDSEGYVMAGIWWVDYILTTANTWAGPIRHFRLTVDKGAPGNIVSWCTSGVRRTSPTTFVVERENYVPTEELRIMVVVFPDG